MALGSTTGTAGEFRDKRYAGQTLMVDLRDVELETTAWSVGHVTLTLKPALAEALSEKEPLVGVLTFDGVPDHALFEAVIEQRDPATGVLRARFAWLSPDGRALLDRMSIRPGVTLRVSLAYRTLNWSFSGFLLGGYHGALADGERFRGMIWTGNPHDPGLFGGHAVRVDRQHHTLSVKFDNLPAETFTLLEQAMMHRDGGLHPHETH